MERTSKSGSQGGFFAPEPTPSEGAGGRRIAPTPPKDQRRLMSVKASAAYCDMCVKLFNVMIRPRLTPIQNPNATKRSRKLWFDRHAIDREIDRLSGLLSPADEPPTSEDREYVQKQMEKRLLGRSSQTPRRHQPPNQRS
jgi:hypothetical protein